MWIGIQQPIIKTWLRECIPNLNKLKLSGMKLLKLYVVLTIRKIVAYQLYSSVHFMWLKNILVHLEPSFITQGTWGRLC